MTAQPIAVEQRVQSKVQILPLPAALPHKCASCGCGHNEDGRGYYDFGIHINYYGRVYICTECIVSLMNDAGWISPAQKLVLNEENNALRLQNAELRGRVVAYGDALRSVIGDDQLELAISHVPDAKVSAKPSNKNTRTAKSASTEQRSDDVSSVNSSDPIPGLSL